MDQSWPRQFDQAILMEPIPVGVAYASARAHA
eukprot:CAMPEP_0175314004 /NCGR_PEP_ID=MMETSP0093-20121207/68171_1 /TAXON_ID=311494 /ORGANISM="Alexandrium monilatum, Strain CCMP3105" /LENGTH=31 /DNA_ID= /DNA_START= /DNA_END= /DNA_ORIENTATION=